jgi:LacI family transcriptional regulator
MAAVTIYDVAQSAGVSIKTVSPVLNAEPNVRPALRERVMAAVQSLG